MYTQGSKMHNNKWTTLMMTEMSSQMFQVLNKQ